MLRTASLPQTLYYRVFAIPHSTCLPVGQGGLDYPALHVRTMFPLQATYSCQPLPLANQRFARERPYRLRVLWADREAKLRHSLDVFGAPSFAWSHLPASSQEPPGSLKFSTLLSPAPRAGCITTLFVDPPRQTLPLRLQRSPMRALCVGFWPVNTIPTSWGTICLSGSRLQPYIGAISSLGECGLRVTAGYTRAYTWCPVYASIVSFGLLTSVFRFLDQLFSSTFPGECLN